MKTNKYLMKIAESSGAPNIVEGTNRAVGVSGGSTLMGNDQKTSITSTRNRLLEAGREGDPDTPINMGSVTGGYSDPGILGS